MRCGIQTTNLNGCPHQARAPSSGPRTRGTRSGVRLPLIGLLEIRTPAQRCCRPGFHLLVALAGIGTSTSTRHARTKEVYDIATL